MFVFFDRNGVVREIINDKPVREGSVKANRIYLYFDEITPYDVFITLQWADLVKTQEISIYENREELTVPYSKDRDLKFFKDFKKYNFYYYDIISPSSNGLATATIRIMEDEDSLYSQGLIAFYVENSIIKTDHYITQAQYDYLITLVARNNHEIERIKYNAETVRPESINTVFEPYKAGVDILNYKSSFNIANMTSFIDSDNVEEFWYACGRENLPSPDNRELISAGFELNFDKAKIGKLQLLLNANKYDEELKLNCYVTTLTEGNEQTELADTLIIPPMEKGVFSFFIFNIYKTDVTKIKIVQEEGTKKNRFYVKSIEPFVLTGKGYYEITQKNGIVSRIDNPDENYLDTVFQYVADKMDFILNNIESVENNANYVKEAFEFIQPAYNEIKVFEEDLNTRQPQIENDLTQAISTLEQVNSQLNQPNGFAQLGADGKIKSSQIPIEKTFEIFPINSSDELTSLSQANVGDIAFIIGEGDGEILALLNYRLVREPYSVYENWLLQGTAYSTMSAYAERCALADNSSAVNGIALQKISLADYNNLTDKTGTYLVVME